MTTPPPIGFPPSHAAARRDEASMPVAAQTRHDAIALERVSLRFGDTTVFDEASASFARGLVHAVMGVSGGGKTTLLRLLMGLQKPDAGRIVGMDGMRRAAVFQEDRLCENLSVAANVRMPHAGLKGTEKEAFLARCEKLLGAMGLSGALARPARGLSGGMKRRVALARAVLADADVLFFDEPLKGLDVETERLVMEAILPLLAGKTVFWTTHREGELAFFDRPSLVRIEDVRGPMSGPSAARADASAPRPRYCSAPHTQE